MMTPSEHYKEAERLLEKSSDGQHVLNSMRSAGLNPDKVAGEFYLEIQKAMIASAQVHAILATVSE